MTFDLILKNIAKHIDLDKEEADFFKSVLAIRYVTKKALILKEGQACKYNSYVQSGALRAFHIDKEDKEATIMFAVEDWWVTDMFCFLNERPAMMYIEAIENSCIIQ